MSYEFYFKKLRKLTLKQMSTEHHVSNLRAYIANNIIPKGLLIKLTPQSTGWKSNRYLERLDSILFDCSTRLLILLYQNTVHILEVLDKTITNIKTDLNKSLTFSDTNNINERLQDIHNIQSLKLREKQRKKFFRDGINPNKNIPSELSVTSGETTRRKRRFSRHKEINRDQNDTVVNLPSKDLKPAEIRILSKGLNFCPTPNKINEEKLSSDLDKFARSLRIKEYFSAKERDCPVDGWSDSEDDNEIPLPRFKKKSSWIPKPSKNTTLESLIDLCPGSNQHQHTNP
jgi:hypothetical protein